jgi:hypothetical protein
MRASHCIRAAALALLAGLTACVTTAPVETPALPAFDAVAAVAAIRASGGAAANELDIQPLRDPQVEDLREQASVLETKRMYRAAADALDEALEINPADPALLQERAEIALLLHQLSDAESFAQRAFDSGSKIGPLCRRHWETIAQVRAGLATAPTQAGVAARASAADARRQRDACTVAAPDRF